MFKVLRLLGLCSFLLIPYQGWAFELDEISLIDTNTDGFSRFIYENMGGGMFDETPVFQYKEEYGCVVAENNSESSVSEAYMLIRDINMSNLYYSDMRLSVELQPIGLTKNVSLRTYYYGSNTTNDYSYDNKIIRNLTPDDNGQTIVVDNISMNELLKKKSTYIQIKMESVPSGFGKVLIKRVKITAKHPYLAKTAVELDNLGALRDLDDGTYVHLTFNQLDVPFVCDTMAFIQDNTGFIMTNRVYPTHSVGSNMTLYDAELRGVYRTNERTPQLKYADWTFDYDNSGWCEAKFTPITEAEYAANAGNLVCMVVDNAKVLLHGNQPLSINGQKVLVLGAACPIDDEIRFVNDIGINNIKYVIADDQAPDYNNMPSYCDGYATDRFFKANQWHTLMSGTYLGGLKGVNYEIAVMESANDGIINFTTTNSIPENQPCLVKFSKDVCGLPTTGGTPSSMQYTKTGDDYNFIGTYEPISPSGECYYLTQGNTIRPLSSGGTIKSFRGFFKKNSPAAAQARSISIDGIVTAINEVEFGESLLPPSGKVYNINGQYIGDDLEALPKGVYVVNGKKVIR